MKSTVLLTDPFMNNYSICNTAESPPSNISCASACGTGCSSPEILITGNNAGYSPGGEGPIETYDFADGGVVNSFVTQSAVYHFGRGLAGC